MKKNLAFLFLACVQGTFAYILHTEEPSITPYHWETPVILVEMEAKQDGISNECREAINTLKAVFEALRENNNSSALLPDEPYSILDHFIYDYGKTNDANIKLLLALAQSKMITIGYQTDRDYFPAAVRLLKNMEKEYGNTQSPILAKLLLEAKIDLGIQINQQIVDRWETEEERKKYGQLHKELISMMKKGGHDLETTLLFTRYLLWGCSGPSKEVAELRLRFIDKYVQASLPVLQEYVAYCFYLSIRTPGKRRFAGEAFPSTFLMNKEGIYNRLVELFHHSTNEHIQLIVARAMYEQIDEFDNEVSQKAVVVCKQLQRLYENSPSEQVQFYVLASMMQEASLRPSEAIHIYDAAINKYKNSSDRYIQSLLPEAWLFRLSYERVDSSEKTLSLCNDLMKYAEHGIYGNVLNLEAMKMKYELYSYYHPAMGREYLRNFIKNNGNKIMMSNAVEYAKEQLKK